MKLVNYEFKARLRDERHVRRMLTELNARFAGTDRQVDTYFAVADGRLKLREGKIENSLIYYERPNQARARASKVTMTVLAPGNTLKPVLAAALGVRAVVEKRREIYYVGNVKIHLDRVRGLGQFLEVEAMSRSGNLAQVRQQAKDFQKRFAVRDDDMVPESYADLVLAVNPARN
jgi:predicted adenylyl cyclase CyaB